MRDQAVWSFGL